MKGVWKSDLTMTTWNVKAMLTSGKMQEISRRKTVYRKKKRKTSFEMDG